MSNSNEVRRKSADESWGLVFDLAQAVERGDVEAVAELVRNGADTEAVEEPDDPTVLMRAAAAGNLEVVRTLVEAGANIMRGSG